MSLQLTQAIMDPGDVKSEHPVFLCHSGAQKGFVAQLNKDLRNVDRYPFFDKDRESLPIGDNFPDLIFKAIKECQVGVVIMSEEFFMRSHWPMFEVVKMVEYGRKIMPVFLGILPEDLSKETTLVRWKLQWEGWKKWNKRIDIPKWEEALRCLKPLNGLVCKDGACEVEFREEIVKEICKIVPALHRWDDSHVRGKSRLSKIIQEKIAETAVAGVRVVGLYGVGGIGKTTACKCVCNDVLKEFGGRVCYVELGNGMSATGRVQEVLRRFTSTSNEFLKKNDFDADKCWSRLEDLMPRNKVFLAIDNVSSDWKVCEEARKYLKLKYFQGSVVMVTARALGELEYLGMDGASCLAMPELVEDEARDLFSYCAGREDVDDRVVGCCINRCYFGKGGGKGGHYHPLALKVLGSQMVGRDPGEWMSQLEDAEDVLNQRREREHPVFSILRRSFDELLDEDKALFMDVALIVDDLSVYEYYSDMGIVRVRHSFGRGMDLCFGAMEWLSIVHGLNMKVLKERLNGLKKRALLVEVGDGSEKSGMHDLWREFAMKEKDRGEQDGRSWVHEVVNGQGEDSCLSGGGWKKLRRICIRGEFPMMGIVIRAPTVKCLELSDCSKLTVLQLVNVNIDNRELDLSPLKLLKTLEILLEGNTYEGDSILTGPVKKSGLRVSGIGKLRNLAVLIWYGVRKASSSAFGEISFLENLQVLDFVRSIEDKDLCISLDLGKLRFLRQLRLRCSVTLSGLRSRTSQLRMLDLSGCRKLRSCPGVGDLEVLHLENCEELEELPNLERLTKLLVLVISKCRLLKALPGLESLVALQELHAQGCGELGELPDISGLTNLEVLDLNGCRSLKALPGVGSLVALQKLHAQGCGELGELPDISGLTNLEVLVLEECRSLKALPGVGSLVALQQLHAQGCGELGELPDISGLTNLVVLDLDECRSLKALPGVGSLVALQKLHAQGCGELGELPDISGLTNLEVLVLDECRSLKALPGVGSLVALQKLHAKRCDELGELPDMSRLTNLEVLDLKECLSLKALPGVGSLVALQKLHAQGCGELGELPDISGLTNLEVLVLEECRSLKALPGVGSLVALQKLHAQGCGELGELPDISGLTNLEVLVLDECRSLKALPGVGSLVALQKLHAKRCDELGELPDMSRLTNLEVLDLKECLSLKALPGVGSLVALQKLHAQGCGELGELPDISGLTNLEVLVLEECRSLKALPGVGSLVALQQLHAQGCGELGELPDISGLTNLVVLDLDECRSLKALPGVGSLVALQQLHAQGCGELGELPDISGLTNLVVLDLDECRSLKALPGVGSLVALQMLHAQGCGELGELPDISGLTNLEVLVLEECRSLKALPGVGSLVALQKLHAQGCDELGELPDMSRLTNLEVLDLNGAGR